VTTHWRTYADDPAYAARLEEHLPSFIAKYGTTLRGAADTGLALDVGCGVGQVVAGLRDAGTRAYGIDVAWRSLARASARITGCWTRGHAHRLPFEPAAFAVTGAFNVLEHLDEPEAALAEMVRVTRPGGTVIVSCPDFLRVVGFRDYHPRSRVGARGERQITLSR
jgi:SAM-dependent methyltransferase